MQAAIILCLFIRLTDTILQHASLISHPDKPACGVIRCDPFHTFRCGFRLKTAFESVFVNWQDRPWPV